MIENFELFLTILENKDNSFAKLIPLIQLGVLEINFIKNKMDFYNNLKWHKLFDKISEKKEYLKILIIENKEKRTIISERIINKLLLNVGTDYFYYLNEKTNESLLKASQMLKNGFNLDINDLYDLLNENDYGIISVFKEEFANLLFSLNEEQLKIK